MPGFDDEALFSGDGVPADDDAADGLHASGDGSDDEADGAPDLEAMFEPQDEDQPAAAKPAAAKAKGSDGVTLSAKEYQRIQERLKEQEAETRYWAEMAKKTASRANDGEDEDDPEDVKPAKGRKAAPAVEDEDTDTFLRDVNARGLKAIKDRGFLTAAEAERLIEERAAAIADKIASQKVQKATDALHSDAQLIRQYPDLADAKSEFSKRVGEQIKELTAGDKDLMKKPGALIAAAAKVVKAEMAVEERQARTAVQDRDRERRIAKQGPAGPRRGSAADEEEVIYSPMQRQMLASMWKGLGVKPQEVEKTAAMLRRRAG